MHSSLTYEEEGEEKLSKFDRTALNNAHFYLYAPLLSVPTSTALKGPIGLTGVLSYVFPRISSAFRCIPLRSAISAIAITQILVAFFSLQLVLATTGKFRVHSPLINSSENSILGPFVSFSEMVQVRVIQYDVNNDFMTLSNNLTLIMSRIIFSFITSCVIFATLRRFSSVNGYFGALLLIIDLLISTCVLVSRMVFYFFHTEAEEHELQDWDTITRITYFLSPVVSIGFLWIYSIIMLSFVAQERYIASVLAKQQPRLYGPSYYISQDKEGYLPMPWPMIEDDTLQKRHYDALSLPARSPATRLPSERPSLETSPLKDTKDDVSKLV